MTGEEQLNELPADWKLTSFDETFDSSHGRFMDTAAVIKNLDLIITVDTGLAHIAAGLGAPVWTFIPNPPDWRWMLDRTDTPWYPNMTLFRQPTPGDWDSVIKNIAEQLEEVVAKRRSLLPTRSLAEIIDTIIALNIKYGTKTTHQRTHEMNNLHKELSSRSFSIEKMDAIKQLAIELSHIHTAITQTVLKIKVQDNPLSDTYQSLIQEYISLQQERNRIKEAINAIE